jgi:putative PIN family toxin of toxin-antitoxin system
VLDTNVIVSGTIVKKGIPFEILTAWREREWNLVISEHILDEVQRVLSLPKISRAYALTSQDITDVVRLLRSRTIIVPGRLGIPPTARDPEDDHFLACAVEGQADYVVTGDHDLLGLGRYQEVPIITPAAFSAILKTAL